MSEIEVPFGPTGQVVYERTYSRKKPDGTNENWHETCNRVIAGNLGLVYGPSETWTEAVKYEAERLFHFMSKFAILPAGRHLWASGVKGRQYLFNCHVAGWGEKLSRHYEFTFLRLMEGGGVGANYSSRFLKKYGAPRRHLNVHIVCDPSHPDYDEMVEQGLLSSQYDSDWDGAYEVADSREGWADALTDLLDTYMTDDEVKHSNRVYDVTNVRCKGSRLKTFGGTASGPAPFARMMAEVGGIMNNALAEINECLLALDDENAHLTPTEAMELDHAIACCVVSGGNRRSARMAIVHWRDPFIQSFLDCKKDSGKHWTTNISVEIDSEFTDAINDPAHPLRHEAMNVHLQVTENVLTNGEPGYWNSELTNEGEVYEIVATNPCGEIGLPEYGACCLGHVNMDYFAPTKNRKTDYLGLIEAHRLMTRFLVRATFGDMNDAEQDEVMSSERRIGVGHFGVQGFFAKRGVRYSDVPKQRESKVLLKELYDEVRKEARTYAFALRIPEPVKVTTVAPTGTIAKLPGATEGIHPIYARHFLRRVRFSMADPDQRQTVQNADLDGFATEVCQYDPSGNTMIVVYPTKDNLVQEVEDMGLDANELVQSADEISLVDMLSFQALYQTYWADNAVSYTVNVPAEPHQNEAMARGEDVPPPTSERLATVAGNLAGALRALKGTTIMLDGSRPQAPYERISAADYALYQAVQVSDGIDENCATGACPVR